MIAPYSFLMAVTLSGNCGPLCSSPTTIGKTDVCLGILISCPLSGREKSNCLTSVTSTVCISMTLFAEKQSISISVLICFRLAVKQSPGTHANRHPMQLLGPPENVALYKTTWIHCTTNEYTTISRTGCRKPRKAFQAFGPRLAIALVGTRRRLVPTNLCSCKMVRTCLNHRIPAETWSERTSVQVVSECGDEYECPCGNR